WRAVLGPEGLQETGTVVGQVLAMARRRIGPLGALQTGPQGAVEALFLEVILHRKVLPCHRRLPRGSRPAWLGEGQDALGRWQAVVRRFGGKGNWVVRSTSGTRAV